MLSNVYDNDLDVYSSEIKIHSLPSKSRRGFDPACLEGGEGGIFPRHSAEY